MMKKATFYGSTTVGERGQIVLPVKLRKDFHIEKGNKLLVMGNPDITLITLINQDAMSSFLDTMSENINKMKTSIKKKGY